MRNLSTETLIKWKLLILGSLQVSLGASLVGVYAIEGFTPGVLFGYLIFVSGYKISWFSVHEISKLEQILEIGYETFFEGDKLGNLWHLLLMLIGVSMTSYGTTLFAQIVLGDIGTSVFIAGIITFGGYMVAHEGVNGVLV